MTKNNDQVVLLTTKLRYAEIKKTIVGFTSNIELKHGCPTRKMGILIGGNIWCIFSCRTPLHSRSLSNENGY